MASTGKRCTNDWASFRRQMPVAERYAYFDHAAVAPITTPAHDVMRAWVDDTTARGDVDWPAWAARVEGSRRSAARLLNAAPEEIAFVPNTTAGISQIAEGFPWQSGDNVVTPDDEFPSNVYPWLHLADRGVEIRRVAGDGLSVDINTLAKACDARTRMIAISWVGYSSGWRNDLDQLAELAHSRGALLCVDAIQGLGVFPIDVSATPIDFLAADGHKWLLGPEGAGILYVRLKHLDRLRPWGVGWNSVVQGSDFSRIELRLKPTAARFEGGSSNMCGIVALGASIDLLLSYGATHLAERVLEIGDLACRRLAEVGARVVSRREEAHASGIVSFELPHADYALVRRKCLAQRVVLSHRAGRLRISPHAYNDETDVERLVAALAQ